VRQYRCRVESVRRHAGHRAVTPIIVTRLHAFALRSDIKGCGHTVFVRYVDPADDFGSFGVLNQHEIRRRQFIWRKRGTVEAQGRDAFAELVEDVTSFRLAHILALRPPT